VPEHVGGVARGDPDVDHLRHHKRDEKLEQRLEHLEERGEHALGVVPGEVASELEHLASEKSVQPFDSSASREGRSFSAG